MIKEVARPSPILQACCLTLCSPVPSVLKFARDPGHSVPHRRAFVLTRPQSSSFIGGSDVPSNLQINIQTCTAFFPRIHFPDHTFRTTNPNFAESSAASYDAIPAEATKQANPVKYLPESGRTPSEWDFVRVVDFLVVLRHIEP
jgi:hypothetical protein